MCDKPAIDAKHIYLNKPAKPSGGPRNLNLEEMERHLIDKAIKKHQGNISKAAKDLGLTRAALYRRMEKYDL